MDQVVALVLAGGRGEHFGALSIHRTKAAFPIGGYHRIIDFVLSNLCHSGARHAGVIIQFLPASLMEHIGSGRAWDFGMADRRLRLLTPFIGVNETRWFKGSGDAIAKNLNLVQESGVEDVLVLSGDHVYRMDYSKLVAHHRESGADVTFPYVEIPPERHHPRFGSLSIDVNGRVTEFIEKPARPISPFVSMGVYCFKRDVLLGLFEELQLQGETDHLSLPADILQPNIHRLQCHGWKFDRPWHYIADLREYFDLHMAIAMGTYKLHESDWDVMTNLSDRNLGSRPPAYFSASSRVQSSIISPGCRIEGEVIDSILSPGVIVERGAVVRKSVILHDVKIEADATVNYAILDKDSILESECRVGTYDDSFSTPPALWPLTVIPKSYRVAPGEVIPAGASPEVPALA